MRIQNSQSQFINPKPVDYEEKFKQKDVAFVRTQTIKERQIKEKIEKMKAWEKHVKSHELAHALVGGKGVSSASYVYTYGPDGKKYIQGGKVSVQIPKGLNEASLQEIKRLKRATAASADTSPVDLTTSAIISSVERTRTFQMQMKHVIQKYEKQMAEKAAKALEDGVEVFAYKKLGLNSTRFLELFV